MKQQKEVGVAYREWSEGVHGQCATEALTGETSWLRTKDHTHEWQRTGSEDHRTGIRGWKCASCGLELT